MKKIILTLVFLSILLTSQSQDKIPSFGKIDNADLEMKGCDFDAGAEALVLFNVGKLQFAFVENIGWQTETEYRIRIKILKESALDRANVKIVYYAKNRKEDILAVSGISYNLDVGGNITTSDLNKKAVFDKFIDDELSEISFAMPDVKVGTVFEYKYKKIARFFGNIQAWKFQENIPVKYCAYNIVLPQYFIFTVQAIRRQEMQKKEGRNGGDGTWYIMRNIPGLKQEPHSTGMNNYIQRVELKLTKVDAPSFTQEYRSTWPKIINELLDDDDFGRALNKNIKGTDEIAKQAASLNDDNEKIRLIYNYVQSNMLWNENYSKYSHTGIKDAWDKKTGNITDINFILINLLRDAGIDAKPLLISTKDNGYINTAFPFLNQFNAVFAYVKIGGKRYIMNAADKFNPFYLIPYDVLQTNALLVDKNDGGLIGISNNRKYKNNIFFNSSISKNGELTGQAIVQSTDYARNIRMSTVKKQKLKEVFEENNGIDIRVDSLFYKNESDELQPLEQRFIFAGMLQSSGEYYFLPFALFTGLGKNPFIADKREMDIDFGFPQSYAVTGSYILPDAFEVNALPKNTRMMMPDSSIALSRMMQIENNIITFRFTLDINTGGFSAESYPYIKEFYKKMYDLIDERIVLKKK